MSLIPIIKNNKFIAFLLCLCYWILPFTFFSEVLDPVLLPRYLLLNFILGLCAVYFVSKKEQFVFFKKVLESRMFLFFFAFCLLSALSLWKAYNTEEGIQDFLKITSYLLLLVFLTLIFSRTEFTELALKLILILVLLLFCMTIFQIINIDTYSKWAPGRKFVFDYISDTAVEATFANKKIYANVCFLLLPFSLFSAIKFKGSWRWIALLCIVILFGELVYLRARAAWIALLFAPVTTFYAAFFFRKQLLIPFWKKIVGNKMIVISITIIGIAVGIGGVLKFKNPIQEQLNFVKNFQTSTQIRQIHPESSLFDRTLMLHNSKEMIKENFLTGVGLSNWKLYFPKYGVGGHEYLNSGSLRFQRPHNDFVLILSEVGIFGLLAYLGLIVTAFVYLRKIIVRPTNKEQQVLAFTMLFGLSGYLAIAFFHFPLERIFVSVLFISMLALILATYLKNRKEETASKIPDTGIRVFLLLAMTISIGGALWAFNRLENEQHLYTAFYARHYKKMPQLFSEAQKANGKTLRTDPTGTPLYWYVGHAAFYLGNIDVALDEFLQAEKINPYHVNVLNDIAGCYVYQEKYELAIVYYQKALNIAPCYSTAAYNLTVAYIKNNELEKACKALAQVCNKNDYALPDYRQVIDIVTRERVQQLIHLDPDVLKQEELAKIVGDKELLYKIFIEAREKSINFEAQLQSRFSEQ